jgi:hypothetical protein
MRLAASGTLAAMKRSAVDPVHTEKIFPVLVEIFFLLIPLERLVITEVTTMFLLAHVSVCKYCNWYIDIKLKTIRGGSKM